MTFKHEYAQWVDELARPKLSVSERVVAWFERPQPEPEQEDVYVWKSVEELFS